MLANLVVFARRRSEDRVAEQRDYQTKIIDDFGPAEWAITAAWGGA